MTREEQREYKRKWKSDNREKIASQQRAWYLANKEKVTAKSQAWYLANKEKVKAQAKAFMESKRHEPVVYYLPEHHYVGVTDCLYNRLGNHKSRFNRLTEDHEIIYTAKDITEARAVERYMHYEMGYNGKKGGTKGY